MTRHCPFPQVIPAGLVLVWLLVFVFVLASTTAVAQFNTGEISGIVTDNSGGVLPGATVSVRHPASGLLIERITDTEGRFFFPALQIGQWDITAVLPGFALQTQKVALEIGRTLNLEFTLGLEGLTERVTVESRAPLLQTQTAEISDVIENRDRR